MVAAAFVWSHRIWCAGHRSAAGTPLASIEMTRYGGIDGRSAGRINCRGGSTTACPPLSFAKRPHLPTAGLRRLARWRCQRAASPSSN